MTQTPTQSPLDAKLAALSKEYRPSMDKEVLHSWAFEVADTIRAYIASQEAAAPSEAALIRWAHDTLYEIGSPRDYLDLNEVRKLNEASVDVILGLAQYLGEKHGKTDAWWEDYKARHPPPVASPAPVTPVEVSVKVKPLEWLNCAALGGSRKLVAFAFGQEFARIDLVSGMGDEVIDRRKAAAQADFNARILSSIIPATKPAVGVEELDEADIYEQAANLGIPAIGGDFIAGVEEFRKQLRLRSAQIRRITDLGTYPASLLLSDVDRVSDSPGVRESKESTLTNQDDARLSIAIALATDRGCGVGLTRADFDVSAPKSALGKAWHDADIALSAGTATPKPEVEK